MNEFLPFCISRTAINIYRSSEYSQQFQFRMGLII